MFTRSLSIAAIVVRLLEAYLALIIVDSAEQGITIGGIIVAMMVVLVIEAAFRAVRRRVRRAIEEGTLYRAEDFPRILADALKRAQAEVTVFTYTLPAGQVKRTFGLVRGISDTEATSKRDFRLAEQEALLLMLKQAYDMGANAVVGIDIDYEVVGEGRCPIVDTWWQTETGGILITPLPGATDLKPGSASKPFFGIRPAIVDASGTILEGEAEGMLVMLDSWPGQMRTVYGDHQRFIDTYFSTFDRMYFSGDGAHRDADGYYWITGRVDDVLNVSGHRMGTAEIESALVAHPSVAEAAVVGYPHEIKGQGIYAYVTLMEGIQPSDELYAELQQWVRKEIGPIAKPDLIQWAPGLPKTRSGKIMRRILRKVAENDFANLGDTSTLADPAVVDNLVDNRMNRGGA